MKYVAHLDDFGSPDKPFVEKWKLYPINTKGTFKDEDNCHLRPANHAIIIDIPTGRNPNELPSGRVDQ